MRYFQSLQVAFAITLSFCNAVPYATPSGSSHVKSYDYIIVGGEIYNRSSHRMLLKLTFPIGGTAGLALASRLTESSDKTVLVLEAGLDPALLPGYKVPGGSQGILGMIPAFALVGHICVVFISNTPAFLGSVLDWGYATLPQKSMNNRVLKYYCMYCSFTN